jgi:hypothetical protein
VKQLNVDNRTAERESRSVYELWGAVKYSSLPDTVYIVFPPEEQLPNGRTVRVRIEEWDGSLTDVQRRTIGDILDEH